MAGAEAIRARVASANDHDALARRQNVSCRVQGIAVAAFVLLRQEFHGEVNSLQLATGNL